LGFQIHELGLRIYGLGGPERGVESSGRGLKPSRGGHLLTSGLTIAAAAEMKIPSLSHLTNFPKNDALMLKYNPNDPGKRRQAGLTRSGRPESSQQGFLSASKENIMISYLVILVIMALSLGAGPAAAASNLPVWKLKQAVAANPQDPQAHYALGEKYESLGQMQAALGQYQEALKLKPNDAKGLYRLGRLMGELGKSEQAIETLKKALKLNPNFAEARSLLASEYNNQGTALMQQGNLEAAKEALKAGLQAKGGQAETEALRNNLGCLYVRENKLDQAVGTFQQVVRQNPNMPQAHYNLALIYYQTGNYQAANREFFALKGINPAMAGELSDYRFRTRTSTESAPPVKTAITFKGSPALTQGSIPSDFR
jgi:tetratricopeptide (TPR) repeat protein